MAKEYSKPFYNSKAWKATQAAYLASRHYICERCGEAAKIVHHKTYITPENIGDPQITLDWDNLEALCQECHNSEHTGTRATVLGLRFDDAGNLVRC